MHININAICEIKIIQIFSSLTWIFEKAYSILRDSVVLSNIEFELLLLTSGKFGAKHEVYVNYGQKAQNQFVVSIGMKEGVNSRKSTIARSDRTNESKLF